MQKDELLAPFTAIAHESGWWVVQDSNGREIDESGDGGFKEATAKRIADALNTRTPLPSDSEVEALEKVLIDAAITGGGSYRRDIDMLAGRPTRLARAAIAAMSQKAAPAAASETDWKLRCGEALNTIDRILGITRSVDALGTRIARIENVALAALAAPPQKEGKA